MIKRAYSMTDIIRVISNQRRAQRLKEGEKDAMSGDSYTGTMGTRAEKNTKIEKRKNGWQLSIFYLT